MVSKDFDTLFRKRELEEINGPKKINNKILTAILIGTFLAITLTKDGLEYLSMKMDDPFVQILDVLIPYQKSREAANIKFLLNQDSIREKYSIDTVLAHVDYTLLFYQHNDDDLFRVKGRSIEYKNPLLEKILDKDNKITGRSFSDPYDCGLIVTKNILDDFGYPKNASFLKMAVTTPYDGYVQAPVPIIAIVKELPGHSSILFTPFFYQVRTSGMYNPYNIEDSPEVSFYVPVNEKDRVNELKEKTREIITTQSPFKELNPIVDVFPSEETYNQGTVFKLSFLPVPGSKDEADTLYQNLVNNELLKKEVKFFERYYTYDFPMYSGNISSLDRFSVIFNSLKEVRSFKDYLYDKHELEVEMSKIKDKENFEAIRFLTVTIATFLFIFSLVSVGIFMYNLLNSHLNKIKMNLGTFKAFGMSNNSLTYIYKNIVYKFCFRSIIIAFITVFLLNLLIVSLFLPVFSFFTVFNIYLLLAIGLIWLLIEMVFVNTAKRILHNSPGDLIYGRDDYHISKKGIAFLRNIMKFTK